ncbi:MAG: hypothetical protein QG573_2533 [Acidobacteriota bacterium]|nr:hypothetical protein [Acidobacteriota bacterium]
MRAPHSSLEASQLALVAVLAVTAWPLAAATCNVPSGGHPTIDSAVRDPACTTAQLAAGSFAESVEIGRDFALVGAGPAASVVAGAVRVTGSGSDVTISALRVDTTSAGVAGCWPRALEATAGAELAAGPDVEVLHTATGSGPCRLFTDGFESGGTLAWSATLP